MTCWCCVRVSLAYRATRTRAAAVLLPSSPLARAAGDQAGAAGVLPVGRAAAGAGQQDAVTGGRAVIPVVEAGRWLCGGGDPENRGLALQALGPAGGVLAG